MSEEKTITISQIICGAFHFLLTEGYPPIIDDDFLFTVINDIEKEYYVDDEKIDLPKKLIDIQNNQFIINNNSYTLKKTFRVKHRLNKVIKYLEDHSDPIVINYFSQNNTKVKQRIKNSN